MSDRSRVLWLSTVAFTLLFAVWLMLGVLGVPIQKELKLSDIELGWLGAVAILAGSLLRFNFGVWTDQYGGRLVLSILLLATAIPTYMVSRVTTFTELLICTFFVGLAGNSFAVGIAWNAAWQPKESQGLALGIFGAGNVGAAVTKLLFGLFGAVLLTAIPASGLLWGFFGSGWRFYPALYSVLLVGMAAAVWLLAPQQDRRPAAGRSFLDIIRPLKHAATWEYSLQYVVVFGAYVALSLILPKFYVNVYGGELRAIFSIPEGEAGATQVLQIASLLTTLYIFPASLLRPLGGWLSDRFGAVGVMWAVFGSMLLAGGLLSLPLGLDVWLFTFLVVVIGCSMGIGKAAVYKLIPTTFPRDVGAVGGMVGLLGALGGFVLPPVWGYLNAWVGTPGMPFLVLTFLTALSTGWFALSQMSITSVPEPVVEPTAVQ